MKKVKWMIGMLTLISATAFFVNCGGNDSNNSDPVALTLFSLTAGDADLNGATSASDVAQDAAIVAVFSTELDATSATSANIVITNTTESMVVEADIKVSSTSITITPTTSFREGASFSISFGSGLASSAGQTLSTMVTRTFSINGILVPDGQVAYWNFNESNAKDQQVTNDGTEVSMTYVDGRSVDAGKAAKFDGDKSIIEIPDGDLLIDGADFTLSFWMKTESENHVDANGNNVGHFVIGLGAFYGIQYEVFGNYDGAKFAIRYEATDASTGAATTVTEDMWFPSLATDAATGGWQGWDYARSVTAYDMAALYLKDVWTQVVYTYDGVEKQGTLYYNGEKMKSVDFDLWPDGDTKRSVAGLKYGGVAPEVVNELAFGFIQSRGGTLWDTESWGGYDFTTANHFKGQLDDIRIFHNALTAAQITALYQSEKS